MLQQVSEKLLGQFVDALEAKLAEGKPPAAAETAAVAPAAAPRLAPAPEPEPIDLLELTGGGAAAKYAAAGAAALVASPTVAPSARAH